MCFRDVVVFGPGFASICCYLIVEYPMERSFCLRVISSSRDVFVSVSEPVNGGESSLVFVCRLLSVVGNFKNTALQARHEKLRAPKILHPKQFLSRSFS